MYPSVHFETINSNLYVTIRWGRTVATFFWTKACQCPSHRVANGNPPLRQRFQFLQYLENSRNQCNQAPLSEVPMQDTIQLLHLLNACHIMQSRYANNPLCSEEVYSLWWLRSLPFWMRVIANISLTKHSRTSRSQRSNTWIMKLACIVLLFGFFDSHESQW